MNGLIPFLWNTFTTHQTVCGQQECDFPILGRNRLLYREGSHESDYTNRMNSGVHRITMGWLRLVGCLNMSLDRESLFLSREWQKRPVKRDLHIGQKRHTNMSKDTCTYMSLDRESLFLSLSELAWECSRMEKSHSCWPRTVWCVVNMFRKNGMRPLIITNGTICYSILYFNSPALYIRLKCTYSVISVKLDWLPGNNKKCTID